MALRKTGSRLTLEGAANYIGGMTRASKANKDFGNSAKESSGGLDAANVKAIALGTTIGGMLLGALNKGASAFAALGREAVGSFVAQERLEQSMTSLVAKELRSADATLQMADAKEQAAGRAEELLGWIQDLAIKSPFDQQGVAMAFRTALAYGFTTDEAQRLTAATIDYTTATGATGPVMNQVALALGQIKAKGKLAGQEMLQLVNAGINVREMLDEMGYSSADVSKGLVSADEFMQKFVTTMEDDFGGAAADSSETLGGLINSLEDIKSIGLREMFGPMFEAALPSLTSFTGKLQELMPVIRIVGGYIGSMTAFLIENRGAILKGVAVLGAFAAGFLLVTQATAILTAVTAVATAVVAGLGAVIAFLLSPIGLVAIAVGGLVALFVASFSKIQEKTNGFFSGMGSDLFEFGSGLIMSLAEGMAAAMTAVLQVLTAIGNMITLWLSPGSPPKLLPDIDKWGTSAMQQFIGGMGSADMGVFKTISGKFEGFMRSLDGGEDKGGLNKRILAMRQAVMSAVGEFSSSGSVSDGGFNKIFEAMKIANPALQSYARGIINVQMAQQKLNDISKKYSDIMNAQQGELDAISKRRQEVVDMQRKTELEGILASATARGDSLAVELAEMELKEIAIKNEMALTDEKRKAEEDAAKAALASAEEQLDVQGSLIDEQIKNNDLLQEQKDELDKISGGGKLGSGGAGAMPGGEGIGGLLGGMGGVSSGIGGALAGLQGKFEQFVKDLAAPFANIKTELGLLTDAWSNTFISIGTKFGEFFGFMQGEWGAGGTWAGIMGMASSIVQTQWGPGGTWEGNIENLKTIVTLLKEHWDSIFGAEGSVTKIIKDSSKLIVETWGEDGVWANNIKLAKTAVTQLQEKVTEQFAKMSNKFDEAVKFVDGLKLGLQGLKTWLTNNALKIEIDFPELPEWAQFGSPLKLHDKMMDFQKFLKQETFTPRLDFGQQPIRPIAAGGGTVVNNYNSYNQQQIQGIGEISANNGVDLARIQAVVDRAIQTALRG